MANLSKRLEALELRRPDGTGRAEAIASCDRLLAFLHAAFPEDPKGCRMDDLARCCGLPSSGAMREAFELGLDEDAFRQVAISRLGDGWHAEMDVTMEGALSRVTEVHGTDGPLDLAKLFPPLLSAFAVIATANNPGDAA